MSFAVGDLVVRYKHTPFWESRFPTKADPYSPQVVTRVERSGGDVDIQVEAIPYIWWSADNFVSYLDKDTKLEDFL